MSRKQYPIEMPPEWRENRGHHARACDRCGGEIPGGAMYRVTETQVSFFRGEDEVLVECEACTGQRAPQQGISHTRVTLEPADKAGGCKGCFGPEKGGMVVKVVLDDQIGEMVSMRLCLPSARALVSQLQSALSQAKPAGKKARAEIRHIRADLNRAGVFWEYDGSENDWSCSLGRRPNGAVLGQGVATTKEKAFLAAFDDYKRRGSGQ